MNWVEHLDIKKVLTNHDDGQEEEDAISPQLKDDMIAEIKKSQRLPVKTLVEFLQKCETVRDFNNWLDRLYDVADMRKVWLGL